ncbi:hypothetical protein BJV82DRAFT_177384 [Fennellomyces sp. T-0311]|nr:hypothetical protein BJV82DRAFT_177384 [Fennellomyces sp. T-0311]
MHKCQTSFEQQQQQVQGSFSFSSISMASRKKRSFFKSFLFPHQRSSHRDPAELTEGQTATLAAFRHYVNSHLGVGQSIDHVTLITILEASGWDMYHAITELSDYQEAENGLLWPPPQIKPQLVLLGSENDANTSCYIDSLLFAMFMGLTVFDPLLTYNVSDPADPKHRLQILLRLFVNRLRRGHLIKAESVRMLRKAFKASEWSGSDGDGNWSQEDVSELYLFITNTFDLPYLPIRLFHGADRDTDDDRVMTDRILSIGVPDTRGASLEKLLGDHFYDHTITGLRRRVDETDCSSITYTDSDNDDDDDDDDMPKRARHGENSVEVTALQVLELLPFYSVQNELGNSIETQVPQSFPDWHLILPILLNRYRYDSHGVSHKIENLIDIPAEIEFNRFVNRNADYPICVACGRKVECVMRLQSAVCHKGSSVRAGHYIAYARASPTENEGNEIWMKLDNLNVNERVHTIPGPRAFRQIQEELARDAYLLFYELVKECEHETTTALQLPDKDAPSNLDLGESMTIPSEDDDSNDEDTLASSAKSNSKLSCKFI